MFWKIRPTDQLNCGNWIDRFEICRAPREEKRSTNKMQHGFSFYFSKHQKVHFYECPQGGGSSIASTFSFAQPICQTPMKRWCQNAKTPMKENETTETHHKLTNKNIKQTQKNTKKRCGEIETARSPHLVVIKNDPELNITEAECRMSSISQKLNIPWAEYRMSSISQKLNIAWAQYSEPPHWMSHELNIAEAEYRMSSISQKANHPIEYPMSSIS